MDLKTYRTYIEIIIRHLKKRYTNLSAEDAFKIADAIVAEMDTIDEGGH